MIQQEETICRGRKQSSTGTQNSIDKKRISLAKISISRISFIQHINGHLQGKTGPEVVSDI